jgi:hypothetical protein
MLIATLFHFVGRNKRKSGRWLCTKLEKCGGCSTAGLNFEFSRTHFRPAVKVPENAALAAEVVRDNDLVTSKASC